MLGREKIDHVMLTAHGRKGGGMLCFKFKPSEVVSGGLYIAEIVLYANYKFGLKSRVVGETGIFQT